jgi:hypothetical protein
MEGVLCMFSCCVVSIEQLFLQCPKAVLECGQLYSLTSYRAGFCISLDSQWYFVSFRTVGA